jgi:hypothetical protein
MTIIFGVIIAVVLVTFAARAFVAADPQKLASAVWRIGLWAMLLLGLYFIVRGPAFIGGPLLFLAVAGIAPSLRRRRRAAGAWAPSGAGGGAAFGQSRVGSRFVDMTLDRETGAMDGVVKEGAERGRRLSDLEETEIDALWRDAGVVDADSAALLFAYYRWRFGHEPDLGGAEPPRGSGAAMSLEDAREILGVGPGASAEDIRAAHRRLLQRAHPDAGGSDWLAAKINAARDRLLDDESP